MNEIVNIYLWLKKESSQNFKLTGSLELFHYEMSFFDTVCLPSMMSCSYKEMSYWISNQCLLMECGWCLFLKVFETNIDHYCIYCLRHIFVTKHLSDVEPCSCKDILYCTCIDIILCEEVRAYPSLQLY